MNSRISLDFVGGVADVRLTRPDKMNALDPPMFEAIVAMIARKEEHVRKYGNFVRNCALALSSAGLLVSSYHAYLQLGGSSFFDCSATGVSCEYVYFIQYGYVTIPVMAVTAFALIILFMAFHKKNSGI